jgi:hypothetical protein
MKPGLYSFLEGLNKTAESSVAKIPLAKLNEKIFNILAKGSPVKVRITPDALMYGGGYFDQVKKEIGLSEKKYDVLAHELGHAQIDENILGRLIQSQTARHLSSMIPSALSGIGAGFLMAKGKSWGILLPAALSAPTLLSEFLASHKGGKKLEESGASEEQKEHYRKDMGQGFRSYLVAPALGTLIAASMHAASRR